MPVLVLQGLFHPARKVREVYWKIYNMLYIGSQVRKGLNLEWEERVK